MRIVVILFLVLIVVSMGSALTFLLRDGGKRDRTVKALTLRVGFSIALFVLLMAGYATGFIPARL
ncbi:MAG: twin transmembrane helix small protein [Rhodocyclaceae bacterium]|nr:twin transmembrane helix small protein [Rhodocyclaceae bacterium]MCB1963158.1 twin transmembrane helix small protein [Rhodocyclaceae bacterium]